MSLGIIKQFQLSLRKLLLQDDFMRDRLKNIYLSIEQDAKYPFMLINMLQLEDCSKFHQSIYSINFEINIFARDKNHEILSDLAQRVTQIVTPEACSFGNYEVAGIKLCEVVSKQAVDMVSTKLVMHYRTLIKTPVANYLQ